MAETRLIRSQISITQLPEDVVANILSRLPVQHIIQLKSVCKSWRSLISEPHFSKLQLARSKNLGNHTLLYLSDPLQTTSCKDSGDGHGNLDHVGHLEYPAVMKKIPGFDGLRDRIKIKGSCNGLICVVFPNGRIFLWNPTIREALELPNNNNNNGDHIDQKDHYVLGLGYDSSIDDYKVLISRRPPHRLADCEILALKSNMWRKVEKQEPEYDYFVESEGILLRGALHWLAYKPIGMIVILAFDIVKEKFSELVELPDIITDEEPEDFAWAHLKESGDSLILLNQDFGCNYIEVWKLKEYGVKSSWTKIFGDRCGIFSRLDYWENVLHYTKTGKFLFEYEKNQTFWLVWYDPKEITWRTVGTEETDPSLFWCQHAVYVESLISLDRYRPAKQ